MCFTSPASASGATKRRFARTVEKPSNLCSAEPSNNRTMGNAVVRSTFRLHISLHSAEEKTDFQAIRSNNNPEGSRMPYKQTTEQGSEHSLFFSFENCTQKLYTL
uniref:Uncharacterized protein n=1 Tax=Anopheles atroparvus TaxID=41427 RepID=A0AAG5CUP5_ANOAO